MNEAGPTGLTSNLPHPPIADSLFEGWLIRHDPFELILRILVNAADRQTLVVRVLATIALALSFLRAGQQILQTFISLFMVPPCQNTAWITEFSAIASPFVFGVSLWLQIRAISRPTWRRLALAVGIPLSFWIFHTGVAYWEANRQSACKVRPLSTAMRICQADPSVYRVETVTPTNGLEPYKTLTLVSPGEVDKAYTCLQRWSRMNQIYSLIIDDSVFRQREHGMKQEKPGH